MKTKLANLRHALHGGFTLIEMMVTIAVAAVLMSIAIPSFKEMRDANSVTSATNSLITALNVTRSEATSRRLPVAICPADATLASCVNSTDWSTGWIAFVDNGPTVGALDSGETVIERWPAAKQVAIEQTSAASYVRYQSDGTPTGLVAAQFDVSRETTNTYPRCVRVSAAGQITSEKVACP